MIKVELKNRNLKINNKQFDGLFRARRTGIELEIEIYNLYTDEVVIDGIYTDFELNGSSSYGSIDLFVTEANKLDTSTINTDNVLTDLELEATDSKLKFTKGDGTTTEIDLKPVLGDQDKNRIGKELDYIEVSMISQVSNNRFQNIRFTDNSGFVRNKWMVVSDEGVPNTSSVTLGTPLKSPGEIVEGTDGWIWGRNDRLIKIRPFDVLFGIKKIQVDVRNFSGIGARYIRLVFKDGTTQDIATNVWGSGRTGNATTRTFDFTNSIEVFYINNSFQYNLGSDGYLVIDENIDSTKQDELEPGDDSIEITPKSGTVKAKIKATKQIPIVTTAQRDALSPLEDNVIIDKTTREIQIYSGGVPVFHNNGNENTRTATRLIFTVPNVETTDDWSIKFKVGDSRGTTALNVRDGSEITYTKADFESATNGLITVPNNVVASDTTYYYAVQVQYEREGTGVKFTFNGNHSNATTINYNTNSNTAIIGLQFVTGEVGGYKKLGGDVDLSPYRTQNQILTDHLTKPQAYTRDNKILKDLYEKQSKTFGRNLKVVGNIVTNEFKIDWVSTAERDSGEYYIDDVIYNKTDKELQRLIGTESIETNSDIRIPESTKTNTITFNGITNADDFNLEFGFYVRSRSNVEKSKLYKSDFIKSGSDGIDLFRLEIDTSEFKPIDLNIKHEFTGGNLVFTLTTYYEDISNDAVAGIPFLNGDVNIEDISLRKYTALTWEKAELGGLETEPPLTATDVNKILRIKTDGKLEAVDHYELGAMTQPERDLITNPRLGDRIFNTTTFRYQVFTSLIRIPEKADNYEFTTVGYRPGNSTNFFKFNNRTANAVTYDSIDFNLRTASTAPNKIAVTFTRNEVITNTVKRVTVGTDVLDITIVENVSTVGGANAYSINATIISGTTVLNGIEILDTILKNAEKALGSQWVNLNEFSQSINIVNTLTESNPGSVLDAVQAGVLKSMIDNKLPKLTQIERDALTNWNIDDIIFNKTIGRIQKYNGTVGANIYKLNNDYIGQGLIYDKKADGNGRYMAKFDGRIRFFNATGTTEIFEIDLSTTQTIRVASKGLSYFDTTRPTNYTSGVGIEITVSIDNGGIAITHVESRFGVGITDNITALTGGTVDGTVTGVGDTAGAEVDKIFIKKTTWETI